ncbi:DUF202 domain-containing protein [Thiotrichales bacterium 19S9-12]|nr:DUF202 domain-containing protein [Thiotrichales bacterium 19S9-11]MCF6811860.1 DUF202 domain-containing protein [Thiotrichales bacterium 19S9-12]
MIKNFRDHAANERTFLAWIRTAITIMAFGFLIERFDIFLSYLHQSIRDPNLKFQSSLSAEMTGLLLMVVSVIMIVTCTIRYLMMKKSIDSNENQSYRSMLTNILLAVLLALVFMFLATYIGKQV